VVSFTLWPLYPRERAPYVYKTAERVGPRTSLEMVVKRKVPAHTRNQTPVIQLMASLTQLSYNNKNNNIQL
jgi:hypothetical protein